MTSSDLRKEVFIWASASREIRVQHGREDRQQVTGAGTWVLTSPRASRKQREWTRNEGRLCSLQVCFQWHACCSKTVPPNPLQTAPVRNQVFRCLGWQFHSNPTPPFLLDLLTCCCTYLEHTSVIISLWEQPSTANPSTLPTGAEMPREQLDDNSCQGFKSVNLWAYLPHHALSTLNKETVPSSSWCPIPDLVPAPVAQETRNTKVLNTNGFDLVTWREWKK